MIIIILITITILITIIKTLSYEILVSISFEGIYHHFLSNLYPVTTLVVPADVMPDLRFLL